MKKLFFALLLVASALYAQEFNYIPCCADKGQVVKHKYYTLFYVDKYKQSEWAAYKLTSEMINGESERENKFIPDPLIKTETTFDQDYRRSGFDKGHLCPAADMSWSQEAMDETFYYSNISPQEPQFNRGIWKKLEEKIREEVKKDKVLYIVTGGVLNDKLQTIGVKNKIAVPEYYYKVIVDIEKPEIKGIGFIFPNEPSDSPLSEYAVTIDSVESLTHINFFPSLTHSLERKLEGRINLALWGLAQTTQESNAPAAIRRCKAVTKEGKRCKRNAIPGSAYCRQHDAYLN
jgi:endonuclease G, mitochondrial